MTVGDFHDAAGRVLAAARRTGGHPVEDAGELAESLAAARLLFIAFANHLRSVAGPGARYQPWGSAVQAVVELLPRTPQLIRTADPVRAQHPLARTYLAATAAIGLEGDLLSAAQPHRLPAARPWLIGETLTRAADAADTLQLLAESSRRMHPAIAYHVFSYATAVAGAARSACEAVPTPDAAAVGPVLEAGIALGRSQTPIAQLPVPLRPAMGRLLVEARGFEPGAPPDRGGLRAYGRIVTAGSAAVAAILEQARGPAISEVATSWRAARDGWARIERELADVATLGRRNPAAVAAARDAVAHLDQLSRLATPAPRTQRDRLLTDAAAIGSALSELATQQRRVIGQLTAAGDLYQPATRLPDHDVDRWQRRLGAVRWLPMPPAAAAAFAAGYTDATTLVTVAAQQAPGASHRPGGYRTVFAIRLTALEQLTRTNARTPAQVPTPGTPRRRVQP